jgi:hypothetical protein
MGPTGTPLKSTSRFADEKSGVEYFTVRTSYSGNGGFCDLHPGHAISGSKKLVITSGVKRWMI